MILDMDFKCRQETETHYIKKSNILVKVYLLGMVNKPRKINLHPNFHFLKER
jgi:hypothetical protein